MSTLATPLPPDVVRPSPRRGYSTAWWGMLILVATEGMVFVILIAADLFLRASSPHWPPPGTELPELKMSVPFSLVLWASSIPIFWVDAVVKKGQMNKVRLGLFISFIMGLAFVGYTVKDFNDLHYGWKDSAYASIFYTIVGLHAFHVVIGLLMSVVVQLKAWARKFSAEHHVTIEVFSLYWHFVDSVWLLVFPVMFLSVHIR